MQIDEIMNMWEGDSKIDPTELGEESIKIPKLHHKYYQIFAQERLKLLKFTSELKKLKLEKYEFFSQGPNDETRAKGWEMPPKGMILKADIPMYMDADDDIIKMNLKIGYQQEKVEFLESIIKSLVNRGFQIKAAIEWQRFTMGN